MVDYQTIEQRLLWQSAGLMSVVAIVGTVMGVITNSYAILLDGIFSFVAVLIKLLMLATSKMISKETSRRFQFGYWQFEPLVLIAEGSFTLIIVVYAFVTAVISLSTGGHSMNFGLAVYYALFFFVAETVYYFYVRNINKRLESNLVHFDNISWSVDAAFSGGLLVSFLIAFALTKTEYVEYTRYIDPLIIIVLTFQMVPTALKILVPSIKQIIGVAPTELHEDVQKVMEEIVEKYKFRDYMTSIQQYGNMEMIEIDILIDKKGFVPSVTEMDAIRGEIDLDLGGKRVDKWLTVSFTGSRRWMATDYDAEDEDE